MESSASEVTIVEADTAAALVEKIQMVVLVKVNFPLYGQQKHHEQVPFQIHAAMPRVDGADPSSKKPADNW